MRRFSLFFIFFVVFFFFVSIFSYAEDAKIYYKLGYTYFTQKNFKEAVNAYKKALSIDPKHTDATYWLGKSYYQLGEYAKAMDAWINTLRIKESHKGAFIKLVNNYYYLIPKSFNTPEGYLNYAKQILKVDDNNFIGTNLNYRTLLMGFATIRRYLRDYPSSIVANFLIAQVYERLSYNFTYQFFGYAISSYKKVIEYEEQKNKDKFTHPMEYWFSYKRLINIYKSIDRQDLALKYTEKMQDAISFPYNEAFKKNNLEPLGVPDKVEVIYTKGKEEQIWYYIDRGLKFIYKDGVLEKQEGILP